MQKFVPEKWSQSAADMISGFQDYSISDGPRDEWGFASFCARLSQTVEKDQDVFDQTVAGASSSVSIKLGTEIRCAKLDMYTQGQTGATPVKEILEFVCEAKPKGDHPVVVSNPAFCVGLAEQAIREYEKVSEHAASLILVISPSAVVHSAGATSKLRALLSDFSSRDNAFHAMVRFQPHGLYRGTPASS